MSSKSLPILRHAGSWSAFALVAVALMLAGCGAVKVEPTTPAGSTTIASRGKVDSPLTDMHNHVGCLKADHLPVQILSPTKLEVGAAPAGATVVFTPTAGAAQAQQIDGAAQGAEVIGSALLYPNQASDSELEGIENCLAQGVQG